MNFHLVGYIGNSLTTNACALVIAGTIYVFDAINVFTGQPVTSVLDVSNDVLALTIVERPNAPQAIALTLANNNGQYLGLSQLSPNATMTIALGYNGTTLLTHTAYLDTIAQVAGAENLACEISGRSVSKFLEQVISRALIYSNQTIVQLISAIALQAGVTLDPLPTTSQFSQTLPCFMLQPGDTWATTCSL
jgi:phage protein D